MKAFHDVGDFVVKPNVAVQCNRPAAGHSWTGDDHPCPRCGSAAGQQTWPPSIGAAPEPAASTDAERRAPGHMDLLNNACPRSVLGFGIVSRCDYDSDVNGDVCPSTTALE